MNDEWRPVAGFEGYFSVSSEGLLFNHRRNRLQRADASGLYVRYTMAANGKRRRENAHVLVLEAFVGPSNGLWGLHRNDIKSDNRVENLYWGTPQQNSIDRIVNGKSCRGEKNPKSRMSDEVAQWVRESHQSSLVLAAVLGVASSTVRAVRLGQNRNRDGANERQRRNYLGLPVGSTGTFKREHKRALEASLAARTRAKVRARGLWPADLEPWPEDEDVPRRIAASTEGE